LWGAWGVGGDPPNSPDLRLWPVHMIARMCISHLCCCSTSFYLTPLMGRDRPSCVTCFSNNVGPRTPLSHSLPLSPSLYLSFSLLPFNILLGLWSRTVLPIANIVMVTLYTFFCSNKSTDWNRSTSGTPYWMQAFWNLQKKYDRFNKHHR